MNYTFFLSKQAFCDSFMVFYSAMNLKLGVCAFISHFLPFKALQADLSA